MPTILQTLLRKPSQSYQSSQTSPYDPTASTSQSRASSLHRGAGGSYRSARSSYSISSAAAPNDWSSPDPHNTHWDWSQYGARKGLTGGPASIHPSEVASQLGVRKSGGRSSSRRSDAGSIRSESVYSNGTYDDDRRSMRSSKSHSSLRSSVSIGGAAATNWTKDMGGSLIQGMPGVTKRTSRRYSDAGSIGSDSSSFYSTAVPPSNLTTSRKYSSASGTTTITTSGYQVVTSTEYIRKKHSKSTKTTKRSSTYDPSLVGDESPPSLSSSHSSAPSSPPVTPLYSTSPNSFNTNPLLQAPKVTKDEQRKEKKKKRQEKDLSIEEAVRRAGLPLTSVVEVEEEPAAPIKRKGSVKKAPIVLQGPGIEHGNLVEKKNSTKSLSSETQGTLEKFAGRPEELVPGMKTSSHAPASAPIAAISAPAILDENSTVPTSRAYDVADLFPDKNMATLHDAGKQEGVVAESKTDDNSDSDIALNEATPTTPAETVEVPRLVLTRTESDQQVAGVKGDVDLEASSPTSESGQLLSQSMTRRAVSEEDLPDQNIKIVATSRGPASSSISVSSRSPSPSPSKSGYARSVESDNGSVTSAAQDQPQWLKRIKALGEPLEPLVIEAPKLKVAPPAPHWTVKHHYEQQQQKRSSNSSDMRKSSAGNLRRPKSIMAPMPEEREEEEVLADVPPLPVINSKTHPSSRAFPSWVRDKNGHSRKVAAPPPPPPIMPHHILAPRPASMFTPTSSSYEAAQRHTRAASTSEEVLSTTSTPVQSRSPSRSGSPTRSESSHQTTEAMLYARSVPLGRSNSLGNAERTVAPKRPSSISSRTSSYQPVEFAPLPFPYLLDSAERERPRASRSSYSDAGSDIDEDDARSISGFSTMSMPVAGAFTRPPKNPHRELIAATNRNSLVASPAQLVEMTEIQTTSLMTAVSVSAVAALTTHASTSHSSGGGWSLFKKAAPPLASTASPRRFDPLRDLTVSSMQPLPKKVKSDEVLVEVFAVPIERADVEKVKLMTTHPDGFGWIPGRGFYGKVVDTGVNVTKIKQGELVWGIQPMKKSGSLAELITVHKSNVSVAPRCNLTVEQVATLPITGTSSFQVMELLCSSLPRGSKILILDAHVGVGNLCLQLARYLRPARDLYLVAHCPLESREDHTICRESGASDVLVDDPLAAINRLHEAEFDVVIDTIGGRRLYDASRRVLHHNGSYITTVGDSSTAQSSSSTQWQVSVRSLRRNFKKKDKKMITYWYASLELDDRESTRDVLDRLRPIVEDHGVVPRLGRRFVMKEACSAFGGRAAAEGGSVVRVKSV